MKFKWSGNRKHDHRAEVETIEKEEYTYEGTWSFSKPINPRVAKVHARVDRFRAKVYGGYKYTYKVWIRAKGRREGVGLDRLINEDEGFQAYYLRDSSLAEAKQFAEAMVGAKG